MLKSPVSITTTIPGIDDEFDEKFRKAVDIAVQYDKVSASLLQRRLSVGYAQAARIMDQLQEAGVIGPQDGSKPREVLIRSAEEVLITRENEEGPDGYVAEEDLHKVPENYKIPSTQVLSDAANPQWSPQLNDAINSDAFKGTNAKLPVILGLDEKNNLQVSDLPTVGNLIVSGNPLSYKEIFIDTLLVTLLLKSHPKDLKLILIDLNHYLDLYNGTPHLLTPVITEPDKSISALRWTLRELDRRMLQFAKAEVRDFDSFNKTAGDEALPRILFVAMSLLWDVETEDAIVRLTELGARAGIHTVLVVNRMSDTDLPKQLKSNVPARLVFKVTSAGDSRAAGVKGAEELTPGEIIYKPNLGEQVKLHAPFTPEANVKEVVEAVKMKTK